MGTVFIDNLEPQSGTSLTLGASGDTVKVASGVTNNVGIAMTDMWRQNTTTAISAATTTVITSNWEQVDDAAFGSIGSAMTQSSGIFTFPSTGIYLISFTIQLHSPSQGATYAGGLIDVTQDNSTYVNTVEGFQAIYHSNGYGNQTTFQYVDVTDTSNVKVRFKALMEFAGDILGATDKSKTYAQFIKLGDT